MLFNDTATRIIDTFGPIAGNEIIASLTSKAALSNKTVRRVVIELTSESYGAEFAANIVSGVPLSLECKRRILIALASTAAGNDLIDSIETVVSTDIVL